MNKDYPSSLYWFKALDSLMSRLPDPENPKWTAVEKEKWHHAFRTLLDVIIKTEEKKAAPRKKKP